MVEGIASERINGIRVSSINKLTYLLFADYMVVFIPNWTTCYRSLMKILRVYEGLSGSRLNHVKMVFIPLLEGQDVGRAVELGCNAAHTNYRTTYLGLPWAAHLSRLHCGPLRGRHRSLN